MAKQKALKQGRLGENEKAFIASNYRTMSVDDIAWKLKRNIATVQKIIEALPPAPETELNTLQKMAAEAGLKTSRMWSSLKEELTEKELLRFEEEYILLSRQFGEIVYAENLQVCDLLKTEILKSRIMVRRRKGQQAIDCLESEKALVGEDEPERAAEIDAQIMELRRVDLLESQELDKLSQEKGRLFKMLKATRDQRVQELQDNSGSILGLIKEMQNADIREAEGRESGLAALARDREYRRLGSLHTYENGEVDRPILSADTLDITDADAGA